MKLTSDVLCSQRLGVAPVGTQSDGGLKPLAVLGGVDHAQRHEILAAWKLPVERIKVAGALRVGKFTHFILV